MSDWVRVRAIVEAALDLDDEGRRALVAERCAGDDALRREVEGLLAEDTRPDDFLDRPATPDVLHSTLERGPLGPDVGTRIGPWLLGERIGTGGMGAVHRAERDDGTFRRTVAIKWIKPGLDSEELLRRFDRERHVLATLDHPNIARLLDAGVDDRDRPYLVMEYVEGRALDEYCKAEKLGLEARVRLVEEVCAAVQAAHGALVVHRDLKPSNILVDADGAPKLLDFGIAAVLTADTRATRGHAPVLTPGYASPEQMREGAVGTASDVYSLGVVLYELLTGALPFELGELSLAEAAERLEARTPLPPSRALTDTGARTLQTSPRNLAARLQGDLDAIVLRALRPEPARRYGTAAELGADLRRWRTGFPVEARPDSAPYRCAKFVRRNRGLTAAVAAVLLTLVAGFVATSIERARALESAALARERFDDVRDFARRALFELDPLLARAEGATAAREQLVVTALEYLEQLSRAPDASLSDEPDAELIAELGRGYLVVGDVLGGAQVANLGRRDDAAEAYGRALELAELLRDVAPAQHALLAAHAHGRLAALEALHGDARAAAERYGSAIRLARAAPADEAALPYLTDALARAYDGLVGPALSAGRFDEALEHADIALELATDLARSADFETSSDLLSLAHTRRGVVLGLLGRAAEAEGELRDALEIAERWSAEVPDNGLARRAEGFCANNLARFLHGRGEATEAGELASRAAEIQRARIAHDPADEQALHDLLASLQLVSIAHSKGFDGTGSELAVAEESLEIARRLTELDPSSSLYRHGFGTAWIALARARSMAGRHPDAVDAARRAVELLEPLAAETGDANTRRSLAGAWWDLGHALRLHAQTDGLGDKDALRLFTESHAALLENVAALEQLVTDGALQPDDERFIDKGRRDAEEVAARMDALQLPKSGP